MEKKKFVSFI